VKCAVSSGGMLGIQRLMHYRAEGEQFWCIYLLTQRTFEGWLKGTDIVPSCLYPLRLHMRVMPVGGSSWALRPVWRVTRELQGALVGVEHLPRPAEPHVAGERLRVHGLRVPREHAGPGGGEPRMLRGKVRGHLEPSVDDPLRPWASLPTSTFLESRCHICVAVTARQYCLFCWDQRSIASWPAIGRDCAVRSLLTCG